MTQHTPWPRRAAIASLVSGLCLIAAAILIHRPILPGILFIAGGIWYLAAARMKQIASQQSVHARK